jgi:hypothetical protein
MMELTPIMEVDVAGEAVPVFQNNGLAHHKRRWPRSPPPVQPLSSSSGCVQHLSYHRRMEALEHPKTGKCESPFAVLTGV